MNDFSRKTIRSLARQGISLISLTVIPDSGAMPFATGERGYILDDNGTQRVLLFSQVLELAG